MPSNLSWVLADHVGNPLRGESTAFQRRLLYGRNLFAEARCRLGLYDELCVSLFEELRNGIPQLHVLVDGERKFAGWWTPMRGAVTPEAAGEVELVFRSPFARLWGLLTAASVTYTAQDQGLIMTALIDYARTAYGGVGLLTDQSWVERTVARDRTYEHKDIGEAIAQLTEVIGGCDFYETFLDPRENNGALAQFHVVERQGSDRADVRFEHGDGTLSNCRGYEFATSAPVNHARAIGAADGTGIVAYANDSDAASAGLYGPHMATVNASDISEAATLAARAGDALRRAPAHVTAFHPDPALAPLPVGKGARFGIGDTIRWNVDDGAMQEQSSPRVQLLEIGFDDSDNVDDLVVGIDPESTGSYLVPAVPSQGDRRFVQQQQEIRRRLSALER